MSIHLRTMRDDDLGFANEVRGIAGWNQTLADWRRFMALEPHGCFVAEWDGVPAGTATTTCYGTELAWIGMVLVHPDFRRRGLGKALLEHCIHYLRSEREIDCIKLDATPEGRPLYEKLGFEAEWGMKRWVGEGGGRTQSCPQDNVGEDSLVLDRRVFAADRSALLASLGQGGIACRVGEDHSFGLMRPGMEATYLGAISAAAAESGEAIARELISCAPVSPLFWDLPDANERATRLAGELGFEAKRVLLRMYLGDNSSAGDPLGMFGICEPALG